MRARFLALLVLVPVLTLPAEGAFPDDDHPAAVAASPMGDFAVFAGSTQELPTGPDDFLARRMESTGATTWTSTWDGPGGAFDRALAVAVEPVVGKIAVLTGHTTAGTGSDVAVVAFDAANGNLLWDDVQSGAGPYEDEGVSVAFDDSGTRVVAAATLSVGPASSDTDWGVFAYDTGGTLLWTAAYAGAFGSYDAAREVAVVGTRVLVTGVVTTSVGGSDLATIALDLATGALLWERVEVSPCADTTSAGLVVVDSPGSFGPGPIFTYVAGTDHGTCASGAPVLRTYAYVTATGLLAWTQAAPTPAFAADLAIDEGYHVFVAGTTLPAVGTSDYLTLAYNSVTGALLWMDTYDTGGEDRAVAIETLHYNHAWVHVAGTVPGSADEDVHVAVYDGGSGGPPMWVVVRDAPSGGDDRAVGISSGPYTQAWHPVYLLAANELTDVEHYGSAHTVTWATSLWEAVWP